MKKEEIIKANVKVKKKLYPKGNDHNNYFVYSVSPIVTSQEIIILNKEYNNFIVSGNMLELIEGNTYDIEIVLINNKKYGDGYNVVSVASERFKLIHD